MGWENGCAFAGESRMGGEQGCAWIGQTRVGCGERMDPGEAVAVRVVRMDASGRGERGMVGEVGGGWRARRRMGRGK